MLAYVLKIVLNSSIFHPHAQKFGLHLPSLTVRIDERIQNQLHRFSGAYFQLVKFISSNDNSVAKLEEDDRRAEQGFVKGEFNVAEFSAERIRNFCIIAHVDHGKSTLADRLMEMTGAIRKGSAAQYLDKLQVERERGITVKAQTVSLVYRHRDQKNYLLNLIDTPGHVDFSYEVSRSLAACQGALLVVDAGQGIQAQTVANFHLASEQGLALVPLINKIDLPAAEPDKVAQQMADVLGIDTSQVVLTSAKTGKGMHKVLPAVVDQIPAPQGLPEGPLRMLLFDAFHDEYRGVICLVQLVDGRVTKGDRIVASSTGEDYEVQEVGILAPEPYPTGVLLCGQVGYVVPGIKSIKAVRVGDTLHHFKKPVDPLPGFRPAKAMVFAGLYPVDGEDFADLCKAVDKLTLNDASVVVKKENSEALGPGFRAGFLGMLHMEVFMQRLEQEYGANVVTTTPTVTYILDFGRGETQELERPSDYPLDKKVHGVLEPTVLATIICPSQYQGRVMGLCQERRGELMEQAVAGQDRTLLRYILPLSELATDLYSEMKARTQGYATFDYEEGEYRLADLQRLDILAHGKPVDALARLVSRSEVETLGRSILGKMKDMMERQQFDIILQASADGRVVARETIKAVRKNVLAKCYGGDVTRKRKLLDKQKEGKQKLKRLGSIEVPQELFPELMKAR
ncbi:hypothetical protein CEUSTIGMA_g2806.t1 [Chlamydomonas eustigma]|uniref:Translation factor GUF1 homolog, mitochondrial n=1 Tax=Chlamydomonas eustigma TaxID=1157962 RepID=A0A250WXL3_9CHLO|nr:hypothetical protein CEUSTIGMA_g2806.t1 [Chlamydomonas eustigma]|eukprot:GAX75362.1 hypothetical protein CEUSTIGMA_g2806.t1 [Chlamydomonas eustigma]